MLEIILSIPPRLYNSLLAILMSVCTIYLYLHAGEISEEYTTSKSIVESYIVLTGFIVFFFLTRFQSAIGKFFKALAYVIVGGSVIYITSELQDKTLLMIIRVIVGLVVAFGVYGFVSFVFVKNKEEHLLKNGWKLDTDYVGVDRHHNGEDFWYTIKTTARSPATGEELTFYSDEFFVNPEHNIDESKIFTVYVDKKNPKKYVFDMESYTREW